MTYSYHSNYLGPSKRQRGRVSKVITLSFCHLQVREREREREMGKGTQTQRHETPSLKSIYKAQISPLLNPSGPSQPAIIPLLCLSGRPDIKPRDLSVYLSIRLWLNYAGPSSVRTFLYNNTKKAWNRIKWNVLHLNINHSFKR